MAHHFTDKTSIFNSFSNTIDPNTTNFFPLLNPTEVLDTTSSTCSWNIHTVMGFSQDSFFTHDSTSQFNTNSSANMPSFSPTHDEKNAFPAAAAAAEFTVSAANARLYHVGNKKRKSSLETTPESSSAYSSPPDSENGIILKNSAAGKGKKQKKSNGKNDDEEKPKDVVHVRARRGQATDSHSLAERVRRGKINERLRCLQDIVPGCHKTVGMAAMLDEIINYVQCLQNQVEFLSMKLTAASNFHDFNAETDTMNMMIQKTKVCETTIVMHKLLRERFEAGDEYGGFGFPSTSQHGPFDHSFGCYPSLPNNNK